MTCESHARVLDSGPRAVGALESLGAEMGVLGSCLAAERCGLGSEGQERPARRLLRQSDGGLGQREEWRGAVTLEDGLRMASPSGDGLRDSRRGWEA